MLNNPNAARFARQQVQEIRQEIERLRDPAQLAIVARNLAAQVETLNHNVALLLEIIATRLDVAVCDFCQNAWFTIQQQPGPTGPRGDARGLLLWDHSCCANCLDQLYGFIPNMTPDELENVQRDVARWLLRYPLSAPDSLWRQDQTIQELMRRMAP